jgi:hypothetical protein
MPRLGAGKSIIDPGKWAFWLLYAVVLVLVIAPVLLEARLWPTATSKWLFWFQLFSGNWSTADPPVSHLVFAYSAFAAVLLNYSPLIVIPLYIHSLFLDWNTRMILNQAFVTRDQMNKQEMFAQFDITDPAILEKINAAFTEGEKQWRINLVELFGEDKANKIFEMLQMKI